VSSITGSPTQPPSFFELIGLSPDAWELQQRRGAIAGRGFHFQDAALTWLAVLGVTGEWPVGAVVPEGHEDGRLLLDGASADVQIKSRQAHLAAVGPAQLAEWVTALARRPRAASGDATHAPAARLVLVVEHGVPETGLEHVASDVPALRAMLQRRLEEQLGPAESEALLARLHVVTIRDPLQTAAGALARTRKLSPAVARLAVQRLAAAMAAYQDRNAEPGRTPAALVLTDAVTIIEHAVELVDLDALEHALRAGLCEAVDFNDPDPDERYLLGVATTPGHVAAGVVIERSGSVGEVTRGLDAKRRVLIAGPSGAGKSAVAWLAVHATRHSIRWYRIRDLRPQDSVAAIDRFARSLEASDSAPVGFVVDDLGHHGVAAWDAIVGELSYRPGVLILGTLREQDLHDVSSRPLLQVVRPTLDEALAQELWSTLRDRGQTSWPGWKEPFEMAGDLVLEYTALLTTGERIETILDSQIRALASDGEDQLLAVLATVAVADLLGSSLSVTQIAEATGFDEAQVRGSVGRLRDEFLLREDGATVRGLHQLRSWIASALVHEITVRDRDETLAATLNVVDLDRLDVAIRHARPLSSDEVILAALSRRVRTSRSAPALAAALHGLQLVDYDRSAQEVGQRLIAGLPPGEIARAIQTRFGAHVHDSIVIDVGAPALIGEPGVDLRAAFAASLDLDELRDLQGSSSAAALADVLVGLAGVVESSALADSLAVLAPRLRGDLEDFIGLLDAARLHGEEVHARIVDGLGGAFVAACAVAARGGYALAPVQLSGAELRFQRSQVTDAPFRQVGPPDGGLVPSLLAALPDGTSIQIDLVDDLGCGIPSLIPLPRPGVFTRDTPTRAHRQRQREWRAALLRAVGLPLWSGRLEDEVSLLARLASSLDAYVKSLCSVRSLSAATVARFERLDQHGRALPPAPAEGVARPQPDGPVGAAYEPDPFVTLLRDPRNLLIGADPSGAAVTAFRLWRVASDLRAAGRWALLPAVDEAVIDRVVELFYEIRILEAERAADRSAWTSLCARSALVPSRSVELTLGYANQAAQQRLQRVQRRLGERLRDAGFAAQVKASGTAQDGPAAVWPPGQLVAEIELSTVQEWPRLVNALVTARADVVDQHRAMTAAVSIAGRLSRCLSGEVAQAWWPRADLAALGLTPTPEPRGEAWRQGVSAAASVRAARRWAALAAPVGPMCQLITASVDAVQAELEDARATLLALEAEQAGATLDELAACDPPDTDLRSRARETALMLADADLTGG
jgi:hypothetical protein